MQTIAEILSKNLFSKEDIVTLLSIASKEEQDVLLKKAYSIKEETVGKKVYLRGLIELSNICRKNCLYCGIRAGNSKVKRYDLSNDEIFNLIQFAKLNSFSSIVLQSGEQASTEFTDQIFNLLLRLNSDTKNQIRVTLSLGEQTAETYQKWFDAGAQRYLLRIESSTPDLYKKIHPDNEFHNFDQRMQCLHDLKSIGYQVGTGVMIGLPFQTIENLADDLLFLKNFDIDMVGMGPYLDHEEAPLHEFYSTLLPLKERFELSLRMIAILRIMMKDINIASTTALQSIEVMGRERGLKAGANVIMPNLTPGEYRKNYLLYDNKPCIDEDADECIDCMVKRIGLIGEDIADDYGDSKHFFNRRKQMGIINEDMI